MRLLRLHGEENENKRDPGGKKILLKTSGRTIAALQWQSTTSFNLINSLLGGGGHMKEKATFKTSELEYRRAHRLSFVSEINRLNP